MNGAQTLLMVVLAIVSMMLSGTVREWAKGMVARSLGDDTAEREGRLTLSPLAHIDPIGTILFPAIGAALGSFVFGWPKPLPVDPSRFRRGITLRRGATLVAVTGFATTFLLALLCLLLVKVGSLIGGPDVWTQSPIARGIGTLAVVAFRLNLILTAFAFLPFRGLAGHDLLHLWLPPGHPVLDFIDRYSLMIFVAVLLLWGRTIGPIVSIGASVLLRLFGVGGEFALLWPT